MFGITTIQNYIISSKLFAMLLISQKFYFSMLKAPNLQVFADASNSLIGVSEQLLSK